MKSIRTLLKYLLGLLALLVALAPVYWMLTISFKHEVDQFAVPPKWFSFPPTLEHYADAFLERSFGQYLVNSLIVAVGSTAWHVEASSAKPSQSREPPALTRARHPVGQCDGGC